MQKIIFDESTVFLFHNDSRDFEVCDWEEIDEEGNPTFHRYHNVKKAIVYTGDELAKIEGRPKAINREYLQLTLEDGSTVTFNNAEVGLFHL